MPDQIYPPWGTVTPAFWTTSARTAAPDDAEASARVRERRSAVVAAAEAGHLDKATELARQFDKELTAEHGEFHLHTVHIRELLAHLAHLGADQPSALSQYLYAVRLRAAVQGPEHQDTVDATRRAYGLWCTTRGDDAQRLGAELLAVVTDIHGPDTELAHRTRERLVTLRA